MTDKILLHNIRYFATEQEKLLHEERLTRGMGHASPYSTLLAAMGNHWKPGCFEAVKRMAERTWQEGYQVCFYEETDRCLNPYDAIGVMRNCAYMKALREGWEYILYVDNDVLPEPDTLIKLLKNPVAIQSPIVAYADGQDHGLKMPALEQGRGLVLVTSCVVSFLLVRTNVFFPWALGGFWQDGIGADEDYQFQKFYQAGHLPFVDTNVTMTCVEPPHFPLDEQSLPNE